MKKLLPFVLATVAFLLPFFTYAQVFSQNQVINPPYGVGVVMSTSTGSGAKLFASSSPSLASIYASSTSATSSIAHLSVAQLAIGSLSGVLRATAGYITTALVNLTSDVTGILPAANGGTGASSLTGLITTSDLASALISQFTNDAGYLTSASIFGYPFPSNATSTSIAFNGGLSGALTGNASTATALQNARTINGVSFNGTANIVVASTTLLADSSTFSGNDTFSNTITGSISGNAGTVTNGVYTTTFPTLFDNRLSATTTLPNLTTLASLSLPLSQTTGTLSVSRGGTGSTTLSGILKGNGTGVVATAIPGTDYVTGSGTLGNCVEWGASNTLTDAGTACGTGGGTSGLSTTSPISGSNLLVYSASGAGAAYGVATSTLTAGTGLTGSFTQIGSGGSVALSVPVSIANGGTATSSAVTNGVYYNNGTNAEADSLLTFNNSTQVFTVGTGGSVGVSANSNGNTGITLRGFNSGTGIANAAGLTFASSGGRTFEFGNISASRTTNDMLVFGVPSPNTVSTLVGINATSTPGALLSVAGSAGGTTPLFMLSTSTAAFATSTAFEIDQNGNVALLNGTTLTTPKLTIGSLSGVLKAASGVVSTAANGTDYTLTTAQSCTNQVITALTAAGGSTCATVSNAMLANSTIGATSPNSTLSFGSAAALGATFTGDLNLAHSNSWSALQLFANASTSLASFTNTAYFGATATTTINADGLGSIKISGTGNITDTPLATAAGTFVAADATGKLIATTTPTGSNFFTNSSIYTYLSTGTNIGVGTSTPSSILTIDDEQTSSLKIYAWGGGGGGGSSGGANFSGGGGGAGAYVVTTISSPAPSYVVDVASGGGGGSSTVSGAGGTGYATGGIGAPSHYSGGGGGSSAFGTAVIACGGGGGGSGPYGSGSGTTGGNGATGTSGGAGGYNSQAGLGGGGGAGATNGSAGANSAAGAGGTGCTTTSGTNGNGSDSPNSGTNFGGGGSSAGASGNGISATTATGAAGSGGAAGGSSSGGNGTAGTVLNSGGGGGGNPTSAGNGGAGAQPGAGGGGAGALAGAGASGEVIAVFTSSSGAISTTTYSTVGTFTFTTPSSPAAFSVWLSGKNTMSIDQYGHLITGGSSPTCGTGCTSIQGDDKTMRILTGSSVLSVTVNFANVWTESPICIPTDMSGVNTGVEASTTVSSVTLTLATALTTKYIGVICQQSNNFTF